MSEIIPEGEKEWFFLTDDRVLRGYWKNGTFKGVVVGLRSSYDLDKDDYTCRIFLPEPPEKQ